MWKYNTLQRIIILLLYLSVILSAPNIAWAVESTLTELDIVGEWYSNPGPWNEMGAVFTFTPDGDYRSIGDDSNQDKPGWDEFGRWEIVDNNLQVTVFGGKEYVGQPGKKQKTHKMNGRVDVCSYNDLDPCHIFYDDQFEIHAMHYRNMRIWRLDDITNWDGEDFFGDEEALVAKYLATMKPITPIELEAVLTEPDIIGKWQCYPGEPNNEIGASLIFEPDGQYQAEGGNYWSDNHPRWREAGRWAVVDNTLQLTIVWREEYHGNTSDAGKWEIVETDNRIEMYSYKELYPCYILRDGQYKIHEIYLRKMRVMKQD